MLNVVETFSFKQLEKESMTSIIGSFDDTENF